MLHSPESPATRTIAALAFPRSVAMDTVCFLETLSAADWICAREGGPSKPIYDVQVLAVGNHQIQTMLGLRLMATRSYGDAGDFDTLMIPGGPEDAIASLTEDAALMKWLRRRAETARRIVAIGTGTFVLAATGLLSGKRVTTHWGSCERLRNLHPEVFVEDDNIFIEDGNIFTAAGVAAAIDLALHLIEGDCGRRAAFEVARASIVSSKRVGGLPQVSQHLIAQSAAPDLLKGVPEWIVENVDADLSVEGLSARAGMSVRNFIRVFSREVGLTPGKFVERVRVERARQMIQESSLPMKSIAGAAGFGTEQNMRRSFLRVLGLSPLEYADRMRERAKASA